MRKRAFTLLLAMVMVLTLLPVSARAETAATSGTCGENVTWSYDGVGTLTISGTGDMENYLGQLYVPWKDHIQSVTTFVINPGVTSVGNNACAGFTNLTEVVLP